MEVIRTFFQLKETAATIIAEDEYVNVGKRGIVEAREIIEKYIIEDPFFLHTFEPYEVPENAHSLIKRMSHASMDFEVGPMAAVAGAISQYAVEKMRDLGSSHAIIDNGGDISLYTPRREVKVGIYTGNPETSEFALIIRPEEGVGGVCTSSGKIGPSISFGNADAVVIISEDAIRADAAATAVANMIRDKDDIKKAFQHLEGKRVKGAIAIVGRHIGLWGDLPEIVKARIREDKITWRWF